MKLNVRKFTFNPFQENSYVVYNELKEAVIIDPGCYERHEQQELLSFINDNGLQVLALLNTHCHIDHVLGNAFVLRNFPVDFYIHPLDLPTMKFLAHSASLYDMSAYEPSPEPTKFLEDKQTITFGSITFEVIFGPGHAPGHVAFYNAANAVILSGDILFKGSFGRTDLPGGSMEVLKKTIHERMFTLPENTVVYSGHGPETTIGAEIKGNYIWQF